MQRRRLTENFDLDIDGLSQITPQEAFALGVEWAIFFKRLKGRKPIRDFCLKNNTRRLEKLAERLGRASESRETSAPNWSEIWIGKSN